MSGDTPSELQLQFEPWRIAGGRAQTHTPARRAAALEPRPIEIALHPEHKAAAESSVIETRRSPDKPATSREIACRNPCVVPVTGAEAVATVYAEIDPSPIQAQRQDSNYLAGSDQTLAPAYPRPSPTSQSSATTVLRTICSIRIRADALEQRARAENEKKLSALPAVSNHRFIAASPSLQTS